MLYLVKSNSEQSWHVGQKLPYIGVLSDLTEVQADGDELEAIQALLPTLTPDKETARVANYYGHCAGLVYRKLAEKYGVTKNVR
jgi:hypothetical protein